MGLRKWIFILAASLWGSTSSAQTLFTYGNRSVSKEEFIDAFQRNSGSDSGRQAMRDYLQLYINYKLKLQAAKDLQLDTLPAFKAEVESYKRMIQSDFMTDEVMLDSLTKEALARNSREIEVTAYYLPDSGKAEGTKLQKTAHLLRQQILSGTYNANRFIHESGVSPLEINAGFISVLSMPYALENIIYSLKPGEVSKPVAGNNGWYIFRNNRVRKARGTITVAQILLYVPTKDENAWRKAGKMADSIYSRILAGEDFGELAQKFSDDRNSYLQEGLLPPFQSGQYDKIFNEQAFAISQDGETAPPFQTSLGYHIVKRISLLPVSQNADAYQRMKQKVLADERSKIAEATFLEKMRTQTGATVAGFDTAGLWRITDSALFAKRNITAGKLDQNSVLISFTNHETKTVNDWLLYIAGQYSYESNRPHKTYGMLFPQFVEYAVNSNYRARLEEFSAKFSERIKEFTDGNLLFEVMQKQVWDKVPAGMNGEDIAAYQHKTEKEWVKNLRKKYPVQINEKVLNSL